MERALDVLACRYFGRFALATIEGPWSAPLLARRPACLCSSNATARATRCTATGFSARTRRDRRRGGGSPAMCSGGL